MPEKLLTYAECKAISRYVTGNINNLCISRDANKFTEIGSLSNQLYPDDPIWRVYIKRIRFDYIGSQLIESLEYKDITHMITGEQ